MPADEVTFLAAGINHQAFILRFERDGDDLYPRLDERIAGDPELRRRVRVALYRRLGYFPTESSEHAAEYVPWFMRHDDQIERYRIPVDEYIRRSEENLVEFERVKAELARGERDAARALERVRGDDHPLDGDRRAARDLRQRPATRACSPGCPDGCCVEVPCLVDDTGLHPVAVPDYPPQLAALNRTYLNVVELTVRAVLEGRPDYVRARGDARPERRRDADARRDRRALRRARRGRTATRSRKPSRLGRPRPLEPGRSG